MPVLTSHGPTQGHPFMPSASAPGERTAAALLVCLLQHRRNTRRRKAVRRRRRKTRSSRSARTAPAYHPAPSKPGLSHN
jgi:hypothetical protein